MIDLKLTDSGELEIGPDVDLAVVSGDDYLAQEIIFRLKTQLGDFLLDQNKGSNLEKYIGQPNAPLTHAAMENDIINSIRYDNLVLNPDVTVSIIGESKVMVVVEFPSIENRSRIIQVLSKLDLREGLVFARTSTRNIS